MTTLGVDFADFSDPLPSASVGVRFGGKGGSFVASYTGAITRALVSIEGVLEADVLAVPLDKAEIEETLEVMEAMDSVESRLLSGSDGLLGGRAGEGCVELLRVGSRGGGAGLGGFWPVRVIVGGGRMPSLATPLGSFPMLLLTGEVTRVDE